MEEIDIKQILKVFWRRKILIITLVIICAIAGYIYNAYLTVPKYKATTTFLLSNEVTEEENQESIKESDLSLNSKVVRSYTELAKSDAVLREVIENLRVNINKNELKNSISIKEKNNTEFVELSVTIANREEAANIANELVNVLIVKVKDLYELENMRIVDFAETPVSPCNINPIKYACIGAGVGFVLSFMIILTMMFFNDSIKDEDDVESKVGLSVLASFRTQKNPESTCWAPKSDHVEGFKALRTNLQFYKGMEGKKTIAVSSLYPGEGKSWVTTNLAIAYAKADYSVVIVDADLRKGVQHTKFRVPNRPGLVQLLKEQSLDNWYTYVKRTSIDNICIIPSGGNVTESSELLLSNRLSKILNRLKKSFDIIIIDSTPSALVTDAVVLSRLVDTNIIVTEYEKTKIKELKKMKNTINKVGGKIAGVIINKVNSGSDKKYYYYGSENALTKSKHSKGRHKIS